MTDDNRMLGCVMMLLLPICSPVFGWKARAKLAGRRATGPGYSDLGLRIQGLRLKR